LAGEEETHELLRDAGYGSGQAFWQAIQANIRERLGHERFGLWFKQSELMSLTDEGLTVGVPSVMHQQYLAQRYGNLVEDAVQDLTGSHTPVSFDVAPRLFREARAQRRAEAEELRREDIQPSGSQPTPAVETGPRVPREWGFDRLIVTESNRLPMAAAKDIAGQANPRFRFLYICGGYGLGKTALLRGVYALAAGPERGLTPMLVSAGDWCTDYYHAIQMKATRAFRRKYRSCDMLIMDDVQYVQGREGCQRELVHTVKNILDRGGRVVLSGKPAPVSFREVDDAFEALIRKAFAAVLVQPNEEERVRIVEELARRHDLDAGPEVCRFIAHSRGQCFAAMEAAVSGLALYAGLEGAGGVTLDMASNALSAMQPGEPVRRVRLPDIRKAVVAALGVTAEQMEGKSRRRSVCHARHVAMYLSSELTEASLSDIARFYGRGSHSTVKHAVDKISEEANENRHLAATLERIKDGLYSRE
jgi:chromosomal replication initiator protein